MMRNMRFRVLLKVFFAAFGEWKGTGMSSKRVQWCMCFWQFLLARLCVGSFNGKLLDALVNADGECFVHVGCC